MLKLFYTKCRGWHTKIVRLSLKESGVKQYFHVVGIQFIEMKCSHDGLFPVVFIVCIVLFLSIISQNSKSQTTDMIFLFAPGSRTATLFRPFAPLNIFQDRTMNPKFLNFHIIFFNPQLQCHLDILYCFTVSSYLYLVITYKTFSCLC